MPETRHTWAVRRHRWHGTLPFLQLSAIERYHCHVNIFRITLRVGIAGLLRCHRGRCFMDIYQLHERHLPLPVGMGQGDLFFLSPVLLYRRTGVWLRDSRFPLPPFELSHISVWSLDLRLGGAARHLTRTAYRGRILNDGEFCIILYHVFLIGSSTGGSKWLSKALLSVVIFATRLVSWCSILEYNFGDA